MDSSRPESIRLQHLIDQVLALPAPARARYLDKYCRDPQLRTQVEAALENHAQTGSWRPMPKPASDSPAVARGEETSLFDREATPRMPGARGKGSDDPTLHHARVLNEGGRLDHLPLGSIGEYDLLEEIARGGMGVVYKARHRVLERLVAIKIPQAGALIDGEERFLREARSAAALRHANVCPIYEVGHTGQHPFIALGFVEGATLSKWAYDQRPNARVIAEIMAKVARAVHYAHDRGVIHRDIKPANIMVDRESGEPILMDFGLAKQLADQDSQMTQDGQVVGTPVYMAPEQAAGRLDELGSLSDVYSLGAVLYVLLTGHAPFEGLPGEVIGKVQNEEPLPPRKLCSTVHRDLETICLKAMAKNPGGRYDSAAALADDLERFSAGEPIQARRESLLSRSRRLLKRHAALVSLLLVTIVAAGAVAYFALGTHSARLVAGLTNTLNEELRESDWSPQRIASLDTRLAELTEVDAAAASRLRSQWYRKYADSVRDDIVSRASLADADLQRYQNHFVWLGQRAPEMVPPLRERLERRLRTWQPVFQLAAPFENLATVIDFPELQPVENTVLRPKPESPPADDEPIEYPVLAGEPCLGNVQLTAEFDSRWKGASQIGLLLHATDGSGYLFRVRVGELQPRAVASDPAATPANAAAAVGNLLFWHLLSEGGTAHLEILRDGRLLRQTSVRVHDVYDAKADTLRLTATREGNRISFAVGKQPPLVFDDIFPYTGGPQQKYGLWWPPGVGLVSLEASRQPLPISPSSLEQGDALFADQQWTAALTQYREQGGRARDDLTRDQARFKEALCLIRLDRTDEAIAQLESVAAGEHESLRTLAACQLWLLLLRQQRYTEGDVVFQSLQAHYGFDQLALLVPEEDRREILAQIYASTIGVSLYQFTEEDLGFLERADKVSSLLHANEGPETKDMRAFQLIRGYHVSGELERGIAHARRYVNSAAKPIYGTPIQMAMECSWMLRQQGQFQSALDLLNDLLRPEPEHLGPRRGLLIERARVHAAMGNWELAEADLDLVLSAPVTEIEYREFCAACLVSGFLYQRRGDDLAAQAVWDRGLFRNWQQEHGEKLGSAQTFTGMVALDALSIGTMSGKMTAKETAQLLKTSLPISKSTLTGTLIEQYVDLTSPALVNMGASPFGREVIRQMAFQEVTLAQYIRNPIAMAFLELTRAGAAPGDWSEEQQQLVWTLVNDALEEYKQQNIVISNVVQLMLTWKGTTNIFGWQGVASYLPPKVRGPTAYVFGHRYIKLGRPADAANFFRTALENAADNPQLAKLAEEELQKLNEPAQK